MPVTDLTNTTWIFNTTRANTALNEADGDIDATIDNQEVINPNFYGIKTVSQGFIAFYWDRRMTGTETWVEIGDYLQTPVIITITGGTDATNSTLISWLETNATQVIAPTKTYKLGWRVQPAASSYQVTITASEAWANPSHGVITFYDGQDNTGDVLLTQNPADKSAYPLTLSVSSGYLYINIYAPDQFGVDITSNDYSRSSNAFIIDKDGTINIQVVDFYD